MSKYAADKALDLEYGSNRVHFDEGEEKELNLPDDLELPEGLSEVKPKKEKASTEASKNKVGAKGSSKKK